MTIGVGIKIIQLHPKPYFWRKLDIFWKEGIKTQYDAKRIPQTCKIYPM